MKEDSLKKRYLYKLLTNIISLPIAIITQAIIPRILGPLNYGNFSFLSGIFGSIIGFFDSGSSIGFYTKLSQRQNEKSLISFYWQFLLLILIILILFIYTTIFFDFNQIIWPLQTVKFIYLGLIWAWLKWGFQIVQKILDAKGFTRQSEIIRIIQKSVACLILISIYFSESISLEKFFYYEYSVILIYILLCYFYLNKSNIKLFPVIKVDYFFYFKEFYSYSSPLFIAALFALFVNVLDRWFLQNFFGSIEQGFFGLAYQLAAVCFLFSSAMTPIFTREFAIAHEKKNMHKKRQLFLKFVPLLYFIAAFLSLYIVFNAEIVVNIIGGDDYQGAIPALVIMAFYPIHQTYGQLCSAVFYSTNSTIKYRNIRIFNMIISLPISYFLIAPSDYFGLGLASQGLAIKMILTQFIGVNILLYYVCKMINLNFYKFFLHQLIVLFLLTFLSFCTKYLFSFLDINYLIKLFLSGLFYLLIVLIIILINPKIISLKRNDLNKIIVKLKYKTYKS